jgi:hypothetical protein
MDQEAIEVLKAIKGEIVKLRNDFLMLRVAVEAIEAEIKKPKAAQQQTTGLGEMFGDRTKIEKL